MDALDKSPRANWPQVIEMAIEAVKNLGYAEGYRVGAREEAKRENYTATVGTTGGPTDHNFGVVTGGPIEMTIGKISTTYPPKDVSGEDRALADTKPTPGEAEEDRGFEFIREIARQIGRIAYGADIKPNNIEVDIMPTGDLRMPDAATGEIRIKLNFNR